MLDCGSTPLGRGLELGVLFKHLVGPFVSLGHRGFPPLSLSLGLP